MMSEKTNVLKDMPLLLVRPWQLTGLAFAGEEVFGGEHMAGQGVMNIDFEYQF